MKWQHRKKQKLAIKLVEKQWLIKNVLFQLPIPNLSIIIHLLPTLSILSSTTDSSFAKNMSLELKLPKAIIFLPS